MAALLDEIVRFVRPFGIAVEEPVILADLVNTIVHLAPAPIVARIPSALAEVYDASERATAALTMAAFLHARGVPVTPPATLLPPGPHEIAARIVTFWDYVPAGRGGADAAREGGALLRRLHDVLATEPSGLPRFDVYGDVTRMLAHPAMRELTPGDRRTLEVGRDRIAGVGLGAGQPIHGDAHLGNLFVGPPLRWSDFDLTMVASREWDLACALAMPLALGRPLDGALALLDGYGSHDRARVEALVEARVLYQAAFTAIIIPRSRDRADYFAQVLRQRLLWLRDRQA